MTLSRVKSPLSTLQEIRLVALRGRKPKTAAEKLIEGNPGRRPITTMVPPPRQGEMICPRSVADNPRALAYWDMYLANAAPGHLAPIDAPLIARMCICWAIADQAYEDMEKTGMLVKAPNTGLPIQSPYMAIVNRQTEIGRKLCAELCLPPAQRNRMGLHNAEENDPTAHFFDA
jgi:P27 family predicted phage terminase small subunit